MGTRKIKVTNAELTTHFEAVLFEEKGALTENLSPSDKNDVKTIVRNEIRDFLKMTRSQSFDTMVNGMIKDYVKKDKELEKYFVEISKNVLVQLYKTLWTKKNFWTSDLKNSAN